MQSQIITILPIAYLRFFACQYPKKPIFSYTKGPKTNGQELPPTPRAAAPIAITIAAADAEAGRGGAPNNQGEILNTR